MGVDTAQHVMIGCVHELLPTDDSPASLRRLIEHECDECGGLRVVVDLTEREIDSRHARVLIETIDPRPDGWMIWLPSDVTTAVVDELRSAGFDGRMDVRPS